MNVSRCLDSWSRASSMFHERIKGRDQSSSSDVDVGDPELVDHSLPEVAMSHTNQVLMAIVLFCGLTLISGQVSAADGKVSGSIEVGGNPLAAGRIMFHTTDGQFVGSKIRNGKYTVDHMPTGTRKVTIEGDGIPAKYTFDDKSPLTVEVIDGENTLDFDIQ